MKILYAASTPLAGVCELMARCVNEYYGSEHEARVLSKGPGKHTWYVRNGIKFKRYNVKNGTDVKQAVEWADVVHCMANVSARSLKCLHTLKSKVWVFQWHGAQIWPFKRVWLPEDFPYVKWIHIGQGWHRDTFFDQFRKFGLKVIPNIISIDDEIHRPLPWSKRKKVVAFAPSNQKPDAVNKKGIPEVQRACREGRFALDMILGSPFEQCMQRKRRAILGIDEVVTPLYHRSGLEFLSQAVPCICSYDDFTASCLKEATGSDTVPFINANRLNLKDKIAEFFILHADEQEALGREGRAWMEKYYHPMDLLLRYFDVYTS